MIVIYVTCILVSDVTRGEQCSLGVSGCRDVRKIQQCVVHELEGCEEPTPSNIVSSLFDYVWQITPCNNMKQESLTGDERTGSGHSLAATAAVVFSAVLAAVAGNRLH
ncbi:hypothetical protein PR048_016621 [Dryococelus australis]|uniref:Uncharacterized protein n=1 Tax=Dryococelus australis TaxID=614101 RepID=A0ABQ9H779_9NEOP|nr:hypothetical protein PR048_016621 [Dryococelus australis]